MVYNVKQIILTVSLIVSFLIPQGIGFAHTLLNHNHDSNICNEKNEQHIHKNKLECSSLHYFANIQYENELLDYSLVSPSYFKVKLIRNISSITKSYFSFLTGRSPPRFNV